jgi:hypothetical protein
MPLPMIVLQMISEGWSATAWAATMACSTAAMSWPSIVCTCQW